MTAPNKRFYTAVEVQASEDGPCILLDGRPLRTPARNPLPLSTTGLAEAVAAEWEAQGEHIDPNTMPLMKLASTLADRVQPRREDIVRETARFAETDLVCYREAAGTELRVRQDAIWQPVLDWAGATHGLGLLVGEGIVPVSQPEDAVEAAKQAISRQDDARLTALQAATQAAASVVLGLALLDQHLSAAEVFAAAHLDETFQAEKWGDDPVSEAKRARTHAELDGVEAFLKLI